MMQLAEKFKKNGGTKQEYLEQAAQIEGIYVPSLYDISYNEDGTVKAITPKNNAPAKVRKQIIDDFDKVYTPTALLCLIPDSTRQIGSRGAERLYQRLQILSGRLYISSFQRKIKGNYSKSGKEPYGNHRL